jgi:hypothetical protein
MSEANDWIANYSKFWINRLDSLERFLMEEQSAGANDVDGDNNK